MKDNKSLDDKINKFDGSLKQAKDIAEEIQNSKKPLINMIRCMRAIYYNGKSFKSKKPYQIIIDVDVYGNICSHIIEKD